MGESMNYIVFDLEWNHPSLVEKDRLDKLPFEIIEIGAVKLDEEFNYVGDFSELIKPQVYLTINEIIHDIIKLETKDFERMDSFEAVVKRFIRWCGEDYIFCTWGVMDLTELQRNMDYFGVRGYFSGPLKYCDVQKLFSLQYIGHKDMQSLENVIDYFDFDKNKEFHRALTDAKYTAEILRKIDLSYINGYYSVDCYHNPKTKDEVLYIHYATYSKYISEEFDSKEDAMLDTDNRRVICDRCDKDAEIMIDWFCSNPKIYCAVGRCSKHGLLRSKIRIKKNNLDKIFIIKTTKEINNDEYEAITNRQLLIRARRKAKRIRKRNVEEHKME